VKTGGRGPRLRDTPRLVWRETAFAVALYACAGLLLANRHIPVFLVVVIAGQATVYLTAPITAVWSMRAQRVPAVESLRRYEAQCVRQGRRRPRSPAPAGVAFGTLLAIAVGAAAAVLV
jgi:hypothetical protein